MKKENGKVTEVTKLERTRQDGTTFNQYKLAIEAIDGRHYNNYVGEDLFNYYFLDVCKNASGSDIIGRTCSYALEDNTFKNEKDETITYKRVKYMNLLDDEGKSIFNDFKSNKE